MPGLNAVLPSAPQLTYEYDFLCKAPSADDTCDGKLWLLTWLHVKQSVQLDPYVTWNIDRLIMPQHYEVVWELDTDLNNEIDYCPRPKWRVQYKGSANTDVMGNYFNPLIFQMTPPDEPNDDGTALTADCKFSWLSTASPITLTSSPASVPIAVPGPIPNPTVSIPPLGVLTGLGSVGYDITLTWLIDLKPKDELSELLEDPEYEVMSEADTSLAESIVCRVTSDKGRLMKGAGVGLLASPGEAIVNDSRTIHIP